jgi:hypothetical protein
MISHHALSGVEIVLLIPQGFGIASDRFIPMDESAPTDVTND